MNRLNVFSNLFLPWRLRNIPQNIKRFFRGVKYAKQRVVRGYCDSDLWSLDWYLANLMEDSLKDLADTCHGYPGVGEFFGDEGYEKWKQRLVEISNHFHEYTREMENPYNDKCLSECEKNPQSDDWRERLGFKVDDELWDKYREIELKNYEYQQNELKLGLSMISEIWNDLWD